jgi:hypothetical protein
MPVGQTAGYFMQRTRLIVVACTLLAAPFFGIAAPTPGCADPTPAGTWWGQWDDGGYRNLRVGDGLTYLIVGSSWDQIWPDSTGQWDWVEPYSAVVCLTNAPDTSWYSPSDTNVSFDFHTLLLLKMRGPSVPSTNTPPVYLDMELSASEGPFICLAAYAGNPSVTYVPESTPVDGLPGHLPYTQATAPLSWARLCIGSAVASPGIPLTICRALTGSSQVELSWAAVTNRLYQMQCCSDLCEPQWTNLGSPIAGAGVGRCAIDAAESQRFYRILEFP